MALWDLSQLDQRAFTLIDLIFEVIFNLGELSDKLEVVFKLINNCLWGLLEASYFHKLLDDRSNELLLAFWPLISFPVVLDLLDESSKLDWVSQGLSFISNVKIVVVKVNSRDTTNSLLKKLLRSKTIRRTLISDVNIFVEPSLSKNHFLWRLPRVRILRNSVILESLDTSLDLSLRCSCH